MFGIVAPGRTAHSWLTKAKSRSTRGSWGYFGMDDEESHHPDALLHGVVRVVEIRAVLVEVELIDVGLAGTDRRLGQARHAVEADGHLQTVPVNGRRLGQLVVDDEAHTVALNDLDRRAGHRAVEAPDIHEQPRQELALDGHAVEVELLDAA